MHRKTVWRSASAGAALVATVIACVALVAVGPAAARATSCGRAESVADDSLDHVNAVAVSCPDARDLVRAWDRSAAAGRIPDRVYGAAFGSWGPTFDFRGYHCQWMNVQGPGAYALGRGRCRAMGRAVEWRYQHDNSPVSGHLRACAGYVRFAHGDAGAIRTRNLACGRAKRVIADALHHGLVGVSDGRLLLARTHIRGFHWTIDRRNLFRARRGMARLTFGLCWNGVTC